MPDSIQKRLRLLKAEITELGGRDIEIDVGKHVKVRFTTPGGDRRMVVLAASPSDWRADRKVTQELRRRMEFTS